MFIYFVVSWSLSSNDASQRKMTRCDAFGSRRVRPPYAMAGILKFCLKIRDPFFQSAVKSRIEALLVFQTAYEGEN